MRVDYWRGSSAVFDGCLKLKRTGKSSAGLTVDCAPPPPLPRFVDILTCYRLVKSIRVKSITSFSSNNRSSRQGRPVTYLLLQNTVFEFFFTSETISNNYCLITRGRGAGTGPQGRRVSSHSLALIPPRHLGSAKQKTLHFKEMTLLQQNRSKDLTKFVICSEKTTRTKRGPTNCSWSVGAGGRLEGPTAPGHIGSSVIAIRGSYYFTVGVIRRGALGFEAPFVGLTIGQFPCTLATVPL